MKIKTFLLLVRILATATIVISNDKNPIPSKKTRVNHWFISNVKPIEERKGKLDHALEAAEKAKRVIEVGIGLEFTTVSDAIESVPSGNSERVIIMIGPGVYKEKIFIDRSKPFITLLGDSASTSTLTYDGTALQYGTVDSATLIVESDYFVGVNLNVVNSAPAPDGKRKGAQALAMRISGDKAAFYSCRFQGFQDTLCDDKGFHFFKDCYVEGTVDFIFGSGTSIYLHSELRVLESDGLRVITAQARNSAEEKNGYSFVHCKITGEGTGIYLGRAWMAYPKVIYAYTEMSAVVSPTGWSDNQIVGRNKTAYYGEYKCSGAGSSSISRPGYIKKLKYSEAKPYLKLAYIHGSKWLLPPPNIE